MAPPEVRIPRDELEAWAQEMFPEEFALFKAEVDKIMTPSSTPETDPNHRVMPQYRDWVCPAPQERQRLNFDTHMCLTIGFYRSKRPRETKTDKICIYMTPGAYMNFAREKVGTATSDYVPLLLKGALMEKDIALFDLWRGLFRNDPNRLYGHLIMVAATYLFLVRGLLPDFRGHHVSKEGFKAVCTACAAWSRRTTAIRPLASSTRAPLVSSAFEAFPANPRSIPAPVPSTQPRAFIPAFAEPTLPPDPADASTDERKRWRKKDAEREEPAKRAKRDEESRVKDLESMVKALQDENIQLKVALEECKHKLRGIQDLLGDEYQVD